MFELYGEYVNRKGKYTVLAIHPPTMRVRYEDGAEAELKIAIQSRIWENIQAEQEAAAARRQKRGAGSGRTKYYIKVVILPSVTEFTFPGWQEGVVFAAEADAERIHPGDRLIYYAMDSRAFIAVATIVGDAFTADPKKYFYAFDEQSVHFFQVDVDASIESLEGGVSLEAVELESQPGFHRRALQPERYVPISEDDFELLAELITELVEAEDEDDFDDDYLEEDE